jgi:hypothetical protein
VQKKWVGGDREELPQEIQFKGCELEGEKGWKAGRTNGEDKLLGMVEKKGGKESGEEG